MYYNEKSLRKSFSKLSNCLSQHDFVMPGDNTCGHNYHQRGGKI